MINLLPPEKKEALFLEKSRKLIIILGIAVLVPLICLTLFLLSIRFYILSELKSQQIILEQTKERYQTPDFLTFNEIIQRNNKILIQLQSFYKKETYFSKTLKTISDIDRPKNLYFTDLSLTKSENQNIKVTASGFSSSREDLLIFQKNIGNVREIENSYFSPESWINPENTKFYLTFEIPK